MTMVLNLTPEQEERLRRFAEKEGKEANSVLSEHIAAYIATLPEPETRHIRRTSGLFAGQIWMSEDFDDELPDSFWFPEEEDDK